MDAKYYTHTTQAQYDVHTLHSGNLYQIITYVKNKEAEFGDKPHRVSGMLLYRGCQTVSHPPTTALHRRFSHKEYYQNSVI